MNKKKRLFSAKAKPIRIDASNRTQAN